MYKDTAWLGSAGIGYEVVNVAELGNIGIVGGLSILKGCYIEMVC